MVFSWDPSNIVHGPSCWPKKVSFEILRSRFLQAGEVRWTWAVGLISTPKHVRSLYWQHLYLLSRKQGRVWREAELRVRAHPICSKESKVDRSREWSFLFSASFYFRSASDAFLSPQVSSGLSLRISATIDLLRLPSIGTGTTATIRLETGHPLIPADRLYSTSYCGPSWSYSFILFPDFRWVLSRFQFN